MEILTRNLVHESLDATNKKEAIARLASILYSEKRILSVDEFVRNVMEREAEYTTGFGDGIAIPHGKSSTVLTPTLSVARCKVPVDWDAMDGQPVSLIFLLAVPEADAGTVYLKMLATLAESLMDEDTRTALLGLEHHEELFQYVKSILGGHKT